MADRGIRVFVLTNQSNGREYVDWMYIREEMSAIKKFRDKIYVEELTEDLKKDEFREETILEKTNSLEQAENLVELHIKARESLTPKGYNPDYGFKMVT